MQDKFMAVSSYLFFVPALYLILSDKRKSKFDSLHAAQALLLWVAIAIGFILLRVIYMLFVSVFGYFFLFDPIMKLAHISMWLYAVYCAYNVAADKEFEIPYISDMAKKLI